MTNKLAEMTSEWDGLSGWLETETEALVEAVNTHLEALEDQISDWADGNTHK
ncbi:hypothetical protein RKT74_23365 (plasmid) [Leclercia pneumoniae]|uniref:hypothetical protein n=1 Tax=Leclercia pneumoniae TaxID=2815358 RepID=UPI0021E53ECF|nr:hypothetical protein [Leclercia pneumoniae]MCV2514203.1 hypothetical protein [Leclercia pneumoniae]WNN83750.1 hypothetical protein RKT74_23365 [Leclercia pneumoniae]